MEYVIIFGVGIILGSIITQIILRSKHVGSLRVDTSDPDGPYLFVELSKDIPEICQKEYVTFKVVAKDFISRK